MQTVGAFRRPRCSSGAAKDWELRTVWHLCRERDRLIASAPERVRVARCATGPRREVGRARWSSPRCTRTGRSGQDDGIPRDACAPSRNSPSSFRHSATTRSRSRDPRYEAHLVFDSDDGNALTLAPWGPWRSGPRPNHCTTTWTRQAGSQQRTSRTCSITTTRGFVSRRRTQVVDARGLDLSRHHRLHLDATRPWLTVFGGTLSGSRGLARDVVARVAPGLPRESAPGVPGATRRVTPTVTFPPHAGARGRPRLERGTRTRPNLGGLRPPAHSEFRAPASDIATSTSACLGPPHSRCTTATRRPRHAIPRSGAPSSTGSAPCSSAQRASTQPFPLESPHDHGFSSCDSRRFAGRHARPQGRLGCRHALANANGTLGLLAAFHALRSPGRRRDPRALGHLLGVGGPDALGRRRAGLLRDRRRALRDRPSGWPNAGSRRARRPWSSCACGASRRRSTRCWMSRGGPF